MMTDRPALNNPRIAFLFLLSVGVTVLLLWVVRPFIVPVVMAAVLAVLLHPLYRRMLGRLGERRAVASGVTVLLSLVLVIVPFVLFLSVLVSQAVELSQSAAQWMSSQVENPGKLQQRLEQTPTLERLLPYQDQIVEKTSQLASNAGAYAAGRLADSAKGTARFFLMLFITLYAMFFFLIDGRSIVDSVLRFTPLSEDDKARVLGTFGSVGRATIKGTLTIGVVQGGLAGLAFWVAGIDAAVFWGAVMTILSIIPGIGTAVVWVPAVIYLAMAGQTGAAIGLALWCAIVVGMADNVLRPVLIGKDIEMPDLLVMLTTLGGLALFGASGIVIGPLLGALSLTIWKLWGGAIDKAQAGA
jgi:predicted PurR-regulated permease PerM